MPDLGSPLTPRQPAMSSHAADGKRSKKRARSEIGRGAAGARTMDASGSGGGASTAATGRRSGTSRRHGAPKPKTRVQAAVQTTFTSLQPALRPSTLEVVSSLGFKTLTPVQASTIPLFLTNKDVAVEVSGGAVSPIPSPIPAVSAISPCSQ